MGHYGPDDTYLMWAIDIINNSENNSIYQFKLKNYVVCENFKYRNRSYSDTMIRRIDRKEEFKKIAQENMIKELKNLS
jgi:tellurite resistance protein